MTLCADDELRKEAKQQFVGSNMCGSAAQDKDSGIGQEKYQIDSLSIIMPVLVCALLTGAGIATFFTFPDNKIRSDSRGGGGGGGLPRAPNSDVFSGDEEEQQSNPVADE